MIHLFIYIYTYGNDTNDSSEIIDSQSNDINSTNINKYNLENSESQPINKTIFLLSMPHRTIR